MVAILLSRVRHSDAELNRSGADTQVSEIKQRKLQAHIWRALAVQGLLCRSKFSLCLYCDMSTARVA